MPRSITRFLLLLLLTSAAPAAAQRSIPAALEVQFGYAIPRGDFGTGETGARPQAGPRLALGGQVRLASMLGLFGNYQQTRFGCANCLLLELGKSMISRGVEVGIDLRPVPARWGMRPWIRGGALYQTLAFSDSEERLTSSPAFGFSLGAGLDVWVHPLVTMMPGVRFVAVPAEFEFSFAPARSIEMRALTLELGVAVRLGSDRE